MTTDGLMSKDEIVAYLEHYAAGESMGAKLLGTWASTCKIASLRGALRMMQLREQSHANLMAERAKELGGTGTAANSDANLTDFLDYLASDKSDADKLREIMRIAPPEQTINQLSKDVARLAADPESQSLVRAIVEDERCTLYALREAMETVSAAG
jgi:hypothetical protein